MSKQVEIHGPFTYKSSNDTESKISQWLICPYCKQSMGTDTPYIWYLHKGKPRRVHEKCFNAKYGE